MAVSQKLADEIEEKRNKIIGDPEYYKLRDNKIKASLRDSCNVFSYWLEHPELRRQILRQNGVLNGAQLKAAAIEGINGIENAWNYLTNLGVNTNFVSHITPELIVEVGKRVLPSTYGLFRGRDVTLEIEGYTPPSWEKIPELTEDFCRNLLGSDYWPVEAGIFTHLHLLMMQPFEDGNKRVARLIQDRIFCDYELPSAVIPSGERQTYFDLFKQAIHGVVRNDLGSQRPFYDYIAGKVNNALDEILGDLDPRKRELKLDF